MKKYLYLSLILMIVACDGKSPITANQNIDEKFGMDCVGVIRGTATVQFYRCENNEVVCYLSYNGNSINCKLKGE